MLQEKKVLVEKNTKLLGILLLFLSIVSLSAGSLYGEQGKIEKSLKEDIKHSGTELETNAKDATVWYNKGVTLGKLGRYEEAIKCFDKVLEIAPKNALVWNSKGLALHNLGRYEEAIKCFDKALEIEPKNALTWNNKGLALHNLGRYEEAITCFDKALE